MNKLAFRLFVALTLITAPVWIVPLYIYTNRDDFTDEFVDLYRAGWKAFKKGEKVTQGDY